MVELWEQLLFEIGTTPAVLHKEKKMIIIYIFHDVQIKFWFIYKILFFF